MIILVKIIKPAGEEKKLYIFLSIVSRNELKSKSFHTILRRKRKKRIVQCTHKANNNNNWNPLRFFLEKK